MTGEFGEIKKNMADNREESKVKVESSEKL